MSIYFYWINRLCFLNRSKFVSVLFNFHQFSAENLNKIYLLVKAVDAMNFGFIENTKTQDTKNSGFKMWQFFSNRFDRLLEIRFLKILLCPSYSQNISVISYVLVVCSIYFLCFFLRLWDYHIVFSNIL